MIRTDAMRQAARAQHHAKAQSGHAKRGARRGNANAACRHQIGAGAEYFAVRQRQRFKRRVMQRLQQGFNADQAQGEIAFALILIAGEIKARAKMMACAVQHQQARAVALRVIHRVEQRFDQ